MMISMSNMLVGQIVYECDFEDATERSEWKLNEGPRADLCKNTWNMGQSGNFTKDGEWGLFISNDKENAVYSSQYSENVVAYRTLTLPEGDYVLFFNWRGKAMASSADGVWVCNVPDSVSPYTSRTLRAGFVDKYRLDTVMNSSNIWVQHKVEFHSDGNPFKLTFVWTNSANSVSMPPSGCVDNIIIIPKADLCAGPYGFSKKMKGTTMQVSWKGDAEWYDAMVFDYNANEWHYFPRLTVTRLDIDGLSEGVAQVFVRSHCGDGFSQYELYTPFYFLPGKCINYLAIDDPTQCLTYVGTASQPRGTRMLVDSGYASEFSRHTLHYMPGETDPRTDNMLKTKPDDALASVRLGNWRVRAEGECIEYLYMVPNNENSVLKLRYAIVLNQPSTPHKQEEQSSFELHIYYADLGTTRLRALPNGCGDAVFHIGYGDQTGWHSVGENSEVMWKDWTEVSVNLREYVGKLIYVRLSTADCTLGGHYSYAYFTLDCENAGLEGFNCGEDEPTTEFTAPDGFEYKWYLASDPSNIISTDQTLRIQPDDTLKYSVDVISLSKEKCYYTLDACGIPRYPVAQARMKHEEKNCRNVVTFYNDSYIYYNNRYREDAAAQHYTLQERVDEVIWDFGDGEVVSSQADSIVHVYPDGEWDVEPTITAYMAQGRCSMTYVLPKIHMTDISIPEKDVHLAKGDFYHGKLYLEPYEFDEIVDNNGCEEITHVYVHETEFEVDTALCEGGYFMLGKDTIRESVTGKKATLQSMYEGVDSIVTLTLHVEPRLVLSVADTTNQCLDVKEVEIGYEVLQGNLGDITLVFDSAAQAAGFEAEYAFDANEEIRLELPDSIEVGYYNYVLKLGTEQCPVPDLKLVLQVSYPSSVVKVKDGVLVVQNEEYSGFRFDGYQWYKNGMPVEGATESYLPMSNADAGAEFTAMLKREGCPDMPFCPIVFKEGATASDDIDGEILLSPTYVGAGETIYINKQVSMTIYNALGLVVDRVEDNAQMKAPMTQGVYFGVTDNSKKVIRFVVH